MSSRLLSLLAVLLLSACATPAVQTPLTPPPGFTGPDVEGEVIVMDDGARLPLTRWTPTDGTEPWAVVVALHGINDSRASFRLAGAWWAEHGIETWAFDQRGFGDTPQRGVWPGRERMVQDLRTAVAMARAAHPNARIAVAGESMGGSVTAAAFGSEDPPAADQVALLAPGVWGWSSQPWINRVTLRLTAGLAGSRSVRPPDWLTRERFASDNMIELFRNGRDPSSLLATRFDVIYGLVDLMQVASDHIADAPVPTLLLYGGHDKVVEPGPMRRALQRARPGPAFRSAYYPDGWHILNRDLQAETIYRDILAWLRDPNAALPSGAGPVLVALQAKPSR